MKTIKTKIQEGIARFWQATKIPALISAATQAAVRRRCFHLAAFIKTLSWFVSLVLVVIALTRPLPAENAVLVAINKFLAFLLAASKYFFEFMDAYRDLRR
ncbi:hypothetical protein [Cupriavidus necator]|uniref:hypothetical protein n=1 Tax=Cupriavidus necator TaxID=106590 RepID=UPI0005B54D09|nr:hypothetical protein [Cupriavidus necator]